MFFLEVVYKEANQKLRAVDEITAAEVVVSVEHTVLRLKVEKVPRPQSSIFDAAPQISTNDVKNETRWNSDQDQDPG